MMELSPLFTDRISGAWMQTASVAIPAAGGRVETTISGHDLQPDPADAESAVPPCFRLARAIVSPDAPGGDVRGPHRLPRSVRRGDEPTT